MRNRSPFLYVLLVLLLLIFTSFYFFKVIKVSGNVRDLNTQQTLIESGTYVIVATVKIPFVFKSLSEGDIIVYSDFMYEGRYNLGQLIQITNQNDSYMVGNQKNVPRKNIIGKVIYSK